MTNAATAGGRAAAGTRPADASPTTWPRMAVLGAVLLALGLLGLLVDGGERLLLAGLGVLAAVRGATMLREGRAGTLSRAAAASGALAVWLGVAAAAVALLSGTATAWALVAMLVLAAPALALAGAGRAASGAVAAVVLAGAGLLAGTGGTGTLLAVGTAVVAGLVALLGAANLLGAVGMWRIARRPAPAPAGGCGGCACGAGGCGSLR
ncbi:hypothetical protein [Modestobacter sp. URMC 112]